MIKFVDEQLKRLRKESTESCKSAFAESTYDNIKVQWRTFLTFCIYFGLEFLPASLNTICIYVQFLSRSFKAVESIKNYVNGVKIMHLINDHKFPHLESFSYKLTIKGITRIKSHLPNRTLPVTPEILLEIFEHMQMEDQLDITFWSLFLIAFFMFSRKSNLVPISTSKFDPKKQLCRKDFEIHDEYLIISIRWSKTIQFGQRILSIPLCAIHGNPLCPVAAFKKMCQKIPAEGSDPAFCKKIGSYTIPITYQEYQKKFKKLITSTGRNPNLYSTHSFRRGGATFAFESGVNTELLQSHGDWRSDAYKKYLEFNLEKKLTVSKKMSDNIQTLFK